MSDGDFMADGDLPPPDARLIAPGARYEALDGRLHALARSDERFGSRRSKLAALLEAHAGAAYDVATRLLTRTSELNDFATDACVVPIARDMRTRGRQLEELAFLLVRDDSSGRARTKARHLVRPGVRRVFAIDVERRRCLEWSAARNDWSPLPANAVVEDPALEAPLAIRDLLAEGDVDDAIARALLHKKNPVLTAALEEARMAAIGTDAEEPLD